MNKQQLVLLSVCNIVINSGIAGLVGLMPVYLTQLGADPAVTGLFLAFAYLALALSNFVGGRLSDRFQHRKGFLILGGVLAVPISWLMSQATTVGSLWILMACLWFVIGIPMAMVTILTGLLSEAAHRGRSFGMLGLSAGFGLFLGGLVSGPIVDRWGFPALFAAFAMFCLLIPVAGVFVQEGGARTGRKQAASTIGSSLRSSFSIPTFTVLLVASVCAHAANVVIFLSRPLIMHAHHFDATAISTAAAVGSLLTLPLRPLVGWLADRMRRKLILVACFLTPLLGLIVQAVAVEAWHFWVSSVLSTGVGISTVVGWALISDMFSEQGSLGTALALFHATPWIGVVLGLTAGGVAIQVVEMTTALLLAALLSLISIILLVPISEHEPEHILEMG